MVLFISFNIFFSHELWAWSKVFHSPFFFFGLAQVRFLLFPTVKVHQEGLARCYQMLRHVKKLSQPNLRI